VLAEHNFINDLNLRTSSRLSVILAYVSLLGLLAGLWQPAGLVVAFCALLLLIALNHRLYRFYCRLRGAWFVLRVVPWHTLYYLYSGLGFAVGALIYLCCDRLGLSALAAGSGARAKDARS
jgi:hypothetical protein